MGRPSTKQPYRGPINGPCSPCGDGDTALKYHDHEPFDRKAVESTEEYLIGRHDAFSESEAIARNHSHADGLDEDPFCRHHGCKNGIAEEIKVAASIRPTHPTRTEQKIDLLYSMARHIRNTDEVAPAKWAVDGIELLGMLRELDRERYDREVKKR